MKITNWVLPLGVMLKEKNTVRRDKEVVEEVILEGFQTHCLFEKIWSL